MGCHGAQPSKVWEDFIQDKLDFLVYFKVFNLIRVEVRMGCGN